jgi:hypothetical protein
MTYTLSGRPLGDAERSAGWAYAYDVAPVGTRLLSREPITAETAPTDPFLALLAQMGHTFTVSEG